jgi:ABC-type transporter Mla subunit MlaD
MKSPRNEAREDRGALAERLTMLAEQLQGASAELADMVSELREQSQHDLGEMEKVAKNGTPN